MPMKGPGNGASEHPGCLRSWPLAARDVVGHSLTIDHGWHEIAQEALDWLKQRFR